MTRDPHRTYHANQALELSELVNLRFARARYGSEERRLVRMREPDGPSTDAGRKARQPLVLIREAEEEASLVFGFVDLFKRTADLRSHVVVKTQYEQRYRAPFAMTRTEYDRMLEDVRAFLREQAIDTRIASPSRPSAGVSGVMPAAAPAATASTRPRGPPWLALLLSMAIGFVLCYLLVVLEVLPSRL
jgi:hypothetical protein